MALVASLQYHIGLILWVSAMGVPLTNITVVWTGPLHVRFTITEPLADTLIGGGEAQPVPVIRFHALPSLPASVYLNIDLIEPAPAINATNTTTTLLVRVWSWYWLTTSDTQPLPLSDTNLALLPSLISLPSQPMALRISNVAFPLEHVTIPVVWHCCLSSPPLRTSVKYRVQMVRYGYVPWADFTTRLAALLTAMASSSSAAAAGAPATVIPIVMDRHTAQV